MGRVISRPVMLVAVAVALMAAGAGGAVVRAATHVGGGWAVQVVPSPAGASSVALDGVSCPVSGFCVAVGRSSLGPLAEEWDGTAWSILDTPGPAGKSGLDSVSCVSAVSCEAVGHSGLGALAEGWDGTSWVLQPVPPGKSASLASVWCLSSVDCVAVGSNSAGPIAEGWNGQGWARRPGLPPPRQQPNVRPVALSGVWCGSAQSCTGAGYSFDIPGPPLVATAAWNGTKWAWAGGLPAAAGRLAAISCSGKVCVAVGQSASPRPQAHVPGPLSLINPGDQGGTEVLPPSPKGTKNGELKAVSCRSSVCEAVGDTSGGTLAERWNGTRWHLQPAAPGAGTGVLAGIACTSPTACIAVGRASGTPLAEIYAG